MSSDDNTPAPDVPDGREIDTLKLLLNALYGAVKRAQVDIQRSADQKIEYYFPVDPETKQATARTVRIPIPNAQGEYSEKEIPLFALVPHHDLMIDQVSVRMKVSLLDLINQSGKLDVAATLPTAGADPDMLAEIEIRLKGTDAVEGIARINDAIVKRI